jgi:hypothetical protein
MNCCNINLVKRYLPFIIFGVGVLILGGVFLFIKGKGSEEIEEEEVVAEIPFDQRPIASLTPSDDGHWLALKVEKIIFDAATLDYELLYQLPDGRTQGVPGSIKLEGQDAIERDLLLGSESSGKFRYDEGVESGSLTLRFRNEKGKLVGKLTTDFHLQSETDKLTSIDNVFSYELVEEQEDFFVTMQTFGLPEGYPSGLSSDPYGVFSSGDGFEGVVSLGSSKVAGWVDSEWIELKESVSSNIGIFVSVSE